VFWDRYSWEIIAHRLAMRALFVLVSDTPQKALARTVGSGLKQLDAERYAGWRQFNNG
jgi:hypothetical protein